MPRVSRTESVFAALQAFARDVKSKAALGERFNAQPEDHLKTSVATLVTTIGQELGMAVDVIPEARVDDVGGRPDLAVTVDGLLVGYIELKAPGIGTTDRELKGRNKAQLRKFLNLPNLVYTDARDWTFYTNGQRNRSHDLRLGDIDEAGDSDIAGDDAGDLMELFRVFLRWEPIVPTNPRALAEQLAPMTRVIRTDVAEGVGKSESALSGIYADWRRTLFPEASPEQFADSYAQTLTYGLLLAKLSGASALDTHAAAQAIQHHSSLLSRTLEILTQHGTRLEFGPGLELLERTIDAVNPTVLRSDGQDPWLYFYEDFLAVYDPDLREKRGVYYTPAQVVKAQVTLIDELLKVSFDRLDGVADSQVTVLDPAVGTGTYLLNTLQRGVNHVAAERGAGAASSVSSQMAENLYGFELLVGPYAVAHLRLTQQVHELGGREPADGVNIYLTDTLESPNEDQPVISSHFERPLVEEHRRARDVKANTRILVCVGNPPYEREEGESSIHNSAGRWIRFGDSKSSAPLATFIEPARKAGAAHHIKNLYNLYVYFWRWALWKVFETQEGPGIVSFITASSFLRGPGFVGMREEMRRTFDELWIVDLEGNSRGTRTTENVFDIRTLVAFAVGVRYGAPRREEPAVVHYSRIRGTREQKLSVLESISGFMDVEWQPVPDEWGAALLPAGEGAFYNFPLLNDLMPWVQSGVKVGRTWVIGEQPETLVARMRKLAEAELVARRSLFKDSPTGRKVSDSVTTRLGQEPNLRRVDTIKSVSEVAAPVPYGFRSFDRQWIIPDYRFIDRPGPSMWQSLSDRQIFATSLFEHSLGDGPAVTFSAFIPDLHHYRGSYGGKDVIPLFRDACATEPNVTDGLLELLSENYGMQVTVEDLMSYIAGVLGHPGYTQRFHDELEIPGVRVPLTKNVELYQRAVALGKKVIAYQTHAERFPEAIGTTKGNVPQGTARLLKAISSDEPEKYPQDRSQDVSYDPDERELRVGTGILVNVDPRVWEYEVSGLQIIWSWLGYRMKDRSGRKSSPLDDIGPERWTWAMTQELQNLLWVLEGIIALEPAQDKLLDEIVAGELFLAEELPTPTDTEQQAPRVERQQQLGLELDL